VFFSHAKYKASDRCELGDTLARYLPLSAGWVATENGTATQNSRDTHVQKGHPCNPTDPQRSAEDACIVQAVLFQQLSVDAPGLVVLIGPVVSFGGQCHQALCRHFVLRGRRCTVIYMMTALQALTLPCHEGFAVKPSQKQCTTPLLMTRHLVPVLH